MCKQELKSLHIKKSLFGEQRVTPPLGTVYAGNLLALTTNPRSREPKTSHLCDATLVCREGDAANRFGSERGDTLLLEGVGFRIVDQAHLQGHRKP